MLVDVSVAGFTAGWHFPGARAFATWAQRLPWCTQGGLGVIRTSSFSYDDSLTSAVAYCARGFHGERGFLDVRKVLCGGANGSPFRAILEQLEISPELSPFEAREPLRMALQDRACLFVLSEASQVNTTEWETLANVVEHYGKLSPPLRLCAIALDSRLAVASEPSFDFSYGASSHRLLGDATELEDALLWQAYLHHRACWESGGSPAHASELGDELAQLNVGDDEALESLLGRMASDAVHELVDEREVLSLFLTSVRQQEDLSSRQAARERLGNAKVLWRPIGSKRQELLPWVSRALLMLPDLPDQAVWALRHNLVCTPLASEIIAHCLRSEAYIRTQLHGRGSRSDLPPHVEESMDRVRNGVDDFVAYPSAYPMPPIRDQDIWAFAPLGDTLNACPRAAVSDLFRHTLRLRNAMSHGHYVTWRHVMHARHQLERFAAF